MKTSRGSRGWQLACLGWGTLAAACGGGASPPAQVPDPATTSNAGVIDHAPVARSLDAVRVHLARPARDLPVVGGLLAKPPYSDVLKHPESMLPVLVGASAGRAIDLERPIDAAIGYDLPVTGAIAFRVRPAEAGQLRGSELRGRLRLPAAENAKLGRCELWRGAELRLICARDLAALDKLAPALAQLATPDSDASLIIEGSGPTYAARLREAIEKQAAKRSGTENSAQRTGREIAEQLMLHQKLTVELGLTPRGIELALVLGYTSKRESPLLQAWLEGGLSPKALPTPHSGGNFSFAYAGSDVFATLRAMALDHFTTDMAQTSTATPQEVAEAREAIERLVPANGRIALAGGSEPSAALALLEKPAATAAQRRKLDAALGQWWLVTLDTPPAPYLEAIARALKLNERKIEDKPAPGKPPEKVLSTRSKLSQARSVPKQLPAGSLHLLDTVTPNKDFKPTAEQPAQDAHVNHILVVPDAAQARVLIAISRSEEVAAAQARAALDSSAVVQPAPGPLLALRMTAAAIAGMSASFDSAEEANRAKAPLQGLLALPSQGQQELILTGSVRRVAGSAEGVELRIAAQATTASAMEWLQWATGGMSQLRN